jgi:hypothetical protein
MRPEVRTHLWRGLLLAFFAIALLQNFAGWWLTANIRGETGTRVVSAIRSFIWTIQVTPDNRAFDKGLRTGDVVAAAAVSPAHRYRLWTGYLLAGRRAVIPRLRNGRVERISVTAARPPPSHRAAIFGWLGSTWCILFAMLIAWRRSELVEARVLALILVLPNLGINLLPFNWMTPYAALDAITYALSFIAFLGWALVAAYAMLYSGPHREIRAVFAGLAFLSALVSSAIGVAGIIGAYTRTIDLTSLLNGAAMHTILPSLMLVGTAACVAVTFAGLRGVNRERFGWVNLSLSLFFFASIGAAIVVPLGQVWVTRMIALSNIGLVLAPVGLTYSLLNRRLLDLGFVINRAAVFTGVSIVLVGTFVLVEWILGEWFASIGHATNVFVSAAVALGLGLSVRTIHGRVDALLDNIFFRKRHEDEQALRTFEREAPYITSATVLLERAGECLRSRANASTASFKLNCGNGRYDDVDENDPALVSLRTTRNVLDLHTVPTQLKGEFAYPMFARGQLLGVMVLGPKVSGESYAPDESSALEQIASAIASTLDALALSASRRNDALLEGILSIQESLADMSARIRRLDARTSGEAQAERVAIEPS